MVFIAPDLDTVLKPTGDVGTEEGGIREGNITVGAFKEIISEKWRRREGTEPGEVVQGAQDREVQTFLKPSQSST